MDVRSLGNRTDLALLQLGGSTVEDHGDHLVIRSPHNPTHWWGNFLLLEDVPRPGTAQTAQLWLDRFRAEFPDSKHVALAFDGTEGTVADLAGFATLDLSCEGLTVMTATSVHAPSRPNDRATYRRLASDGDWEQSITLRGACHDDREDPASHAVFARRAAETHRATVEAGHGAWWGAFVDERLVSQMGMLRASEGLGRFQSVETHPEFRGRGLAGTLVHRVSQYAFDELDAQTLVMVADPEYLAIRIYRSVGFADTETQLQAERAPQR